MPLKMRPPVPPIELPVPEFEHYSDSDDDDQVEYQVDLGAESPRSTIAEEELPWTVKADDAPINLRQRKPVSRLQAKANDCDCGECVGQAIIAMPCCRNSFCIDRLVENSRTTNLCPSCHTPYNLEEILASRRDTLSVESDTSNTISEDEYDSFQNDLHPLTVAQLAGGATSSVLSRALGTAALMVFLYALTFRSS